MSVTDLTTPAFARRHPDMICWRVAAIYRCCLRLDMPKDWALAKLREICPEGHRDHMADLWFANIEDVRRYDRTQRADPALAADPVDTGCDMAMAA